MRGGLPEDQELIVLLSTKVVPAMMWPMVDVDILQHFIAINNVLWLEIFLRINGVFVAYSKRIVVQRAEQWLPQRDVLATLAKELLCFVIVPTNDLSDQVFG